MGGNGSARPTQGFPYLRLGNEAGECDLRGNQVSGDTASDSPTATVVVDIVQADLGRWTFDGEEALGVGKRWRQVPLFFPFNFSDSITPSRRSSLVS